VRRCVLGKDT